MKKFIVFLLLFVLLMPISPRPIRLVKITNEKKHTIQVGENTPSPSIMDVNSFEDYIAEEIAVIFVETVKERNTAVSPVKFRNVIVRPKFRVQSARQNVDDGISFICF